MRYLSLFSGMEAAHLAWAPLGWECVGVSEIDPAACQLLKQRLPHVPNLGSVVDITEAQIAALGRFDVVIGGSPCQDLSVAGRRAGLAGARSSLFHGPRYKMLGNSFAVPVIRWIGQQIEQAQECSS